MLNFRNNRIKDVEEASADAKAIADEIRIQIAAEELDRRQHPVAILYDNARESSILNIVGSIMTRLHPPGDNFPYAGLEALLSNPDANACVNAFRDTSRFLSRTHREAYGESLREEHRHLMSKLGQLKFVGFAEPPQAQGFAQSVGYLLECLGCVEAGNIHAAEDKFIEAGQHFVVACEKGSERG